MMVARLPIQKRRIGPGWQKGRGNFPRWSRRMLECEAEYLYFAGLAAAVVGQFRQEQSHGFRFIQ